MTKGVPPQAGSGHSPKGGAASSTASPAQPSVPNAEQRILRAVRRALEPLSSPGLNWQEYYRRLQHAPANVLHELRESEVLFRLSEQADWPLLIEAFSTRPYTLTIRTQMTIGGQTFGFDQQNDDRMIYTILPRELAIHMAKHAVRSTLEAAAEPYFPEAARQIASAIEARRAATAETGAVHESAVLAEQTPNTGRGTSHG